MTLDARLDALARGWRGPLFAALVALVAGLPGLIALPPLDRDEARFAQSTAQMIESGDPIDVRFQDESRPREPLALHWLQAASVSVLSSDDARQIWAYRIPSWLGAALAAAACAWGASVWFGPGAGAVAGAMLGGGFLLSTEAAIGRTDALSCGAITLAMAALGRLYAASNGGEPAGRRTRLALWLGMALAILDEGLLGPLIIAVTVLALWVWDRRAPWLRTLGWGWGPIILAALVGPWIVAVTVRTDGGAWTNGAPDALAGIGPGGWAPPGVDLLAAPALLFPFAALAPAALTEAWKARMAPGVRFALCWLVPNWLMLEAAPIRLLHQTLPLYGAAAWLFAFALTRPIGPASRWIGAALSILSAVSLGAVAGYLALVFGEAPSDAPAVAIIALSLAAGVSGVLALMPRRRLPALAAAAVFGIAAHGLLLAGLVPRLDSLWLSPRVVALMDRSGMDPRKGLAPGPVTVLGFNQPSLVFLLGAGAEFGEPDDAAQAISEGRPVIVERASEPDFQHALTAAGLKAEKVGAISGMDYVAGREAGLNVYRAAEPPLAPKTGDAGAPDQVGPPASAVTSKDQKHP